jgi:hypothetical protein
MPKLILAFLLASLVPAAACGQARKARDESDVRRALERLIRAFDDLDREAFRQSFLDQATAKKARHSPGECIKQKPGRIV